MAEYTQVPRLYLIGYQEVPVRYFSKGAPGWCHFHFLKIYIHLYLFINIPFGNEYAVRFANKHGCNFKPINSSHAHKTRSRFLFLVVFVLLMNYICICFFEVIEKSGIIKEAEMIWVLISLYLHVLHLWVLGNVEWVTCGSGYSVLGTELDILNQACLYQAAVSLV